MKRWLFFSFLSHPVIIDPVELPLSLNHSRSEVKAQHTCTHRRGQSVPLGRGSSVVVRVHGGYSVLVLRLPGCLPSRHVSHLCQTPGACLSGLVLPPQSLCLLGSGWDTAAGQELRSPVQSTAGLEGQLSGKLNSLHSERVLLLFLFFPQTDDIANLLPGSRKFCQIKIPFKPVVLESPL